MTFLEHYPHTPDAHFAPIRPPAEVLIVNATRFRANLATFLHVDMPVSRLATGPFRTDLTPDRDDIFVAILSLLLLLCVQAIVASLLLRPHRGHRLSNRAFSLHHFLALTRDFRVRHLFRGRGSVARKMPLDRRLAALALIVLFVTFAVEFLILFFSSPDLVPVTNEVASISLAQPVAPEWPIVRVASTASTNPCSVVFLSGVEQRRTRITTCLTSNLKNVDSRSFTHKFDEDAEKVEIVITSNLHEYGMTHLISVGGVAAEYQAMAYYTLDDGKNRIVPNRIIRGNILRGMKYVHNALISFVFSAYKNDTQDSRITIDLLERLLIKTENAPGPDINVLKINNVEKFVRVVSDQYTTTVTNAPPIDAAATLSFARAVLKSMIAVRVTGPDTKDLFMGSGARAENVAVVWYESARSLNWLTLILLLVGALLFLFWLRLCLHSVAAADIAGLLVKEVVHADKGRSPIEMEDNEEKSFYVGATWNGSDYHYGADTSEDEWRRVEGAYDDFPLRGRGLDEASGQKRLAKQVVSSTLKPR